MRFTKSVLAVAAALFLVASLSAQTPAPAQAPAQPKAAASEYDRTLLKPFSLKEKAPDTFQVKFETTRGDFVMNVTRAWAPNGADRFYTLVRHHFYDNMVIFRVVPNFVVQFGISSYPPVNAAWRGDTITDDPVLQSNKRGYVTFAMAGPNTRTTQLFISFTDKNSFLDSKGFAPFATINKEGMKVVDKFYDQYGDDPSNDQDSIQTQGKAFLDKKYPKLDVIKHATILGPAAAEPATEPAAAPAATNP
jgi:peptidyl-prolyl cis-trans isomerase A (cyclophilin A)